MGRIPEAHARTASTDAVLLGWTGDNGDPDNFLCVLLGCDAVGDTNRARWCNKPFDDLISKAKTTSDQARAHQALRAGAGDLQGRGALGDDRPFGELTCRCARRWSTTRSTPSAATSSTASTSRAEAGSADRPNFVLGGRPRRSPPPLRAGNQEQSSLDGKPMPRSPGRATSDAPSCRRAGPRSCGSGGAGPAP